MRWIPSNRTAKRIAVLLLRATNAGHTLEPRERSPCVDVVCTSRLFIGQRVLMGKLWVKHGSAVLQTTAAPAEPDSIDDELSRAASG